MLAAMRGKLSAPSGSAIIVVAMAAADGADGRPVGVVEMYKDAVPDIAARLHTACDREFGFGWLASMAVAPEFHRQGLGRALVEAALEPVRTEWGYDRVALHVFEDNEAALGLYKAMGFETVDSQPQVWMQWLKQRQQQLMLLDISS